MTIDSETAEAKSKDAAGRDVYFCSVDCQRTYEAHPEKYDERAATPPVASDVPADRSLEGDTPSYKRQNGKFDEEGRSLPS